MTTNDRMTRFTIVGGGSAGRLTASLLMAYLNRRNDGPDTEVTVIESPSLPIIGVGEATTKQIFSIIAMPHLRGAVRFKDWNINSDGSDGHYYHPFDAPQPILGIDPAYRLSSAFRARGSAA